MNVAGFKDLFFDREAVQRAADAVIRKGLSKFGAFTRKRAKSSLKYGKKTSAPGSLPVVHRSARFARKTVNKKTGAVKAQPASPERELLLFAFDPAKRSVVVGVARGGPDTGAPAALEHGGSVTITAGKNKGKRARIAARPVIGPAAAAELSNFKDLIR